MMTLLRRLGWIAVAVLAVYALAWLALPPLLKTQVERRATEALGRAVTAGVIEFEPWQLRLTLRDLAVAGRAAGEPPLLAVSRLSVDADLRSLWHRAPVLEALDIETPKLRIARLTDGGYDIDDLIAKFSAPSGGQGDGKGARFALYNLRLEGGEIDFDDQPSKRRHRVEALSIALPFLSTLPAHVDVTVSPRLAFRLNGASFDSGAQAKPFAEQREATLQLRVPDLDLAPYLAYWPAVMAARLERGRVAIDLALSFRQLPDVTPTVTLSGRAALRDAALVLPDGRPLGTWRELEVPLSAVQPLARKATLGNIKLDAPSVMLARDAAGRLVLPQPAQSRVEAAEAWAVEVESIHVTNGSLAWRDAATVPPAEIGIGAIDLLVQRVAWPVAAAMPIKLAAQLQPGVGRLAVEGEATDRSARVGVRIDDLALSALAPYLAPVLRPRLDGTLNAATRIEWNAEPAALRLAVEAARVADVRLADGRSEVVSLHELTVSDAAIDLQARRITLGRLAVAQPVLQLERARDGTLAVQRWVAASPGPRRPATSRKAADTEPGWQVQLGELAIDNGRLRLVDAVPAEPVRVDVNVLRFVMQGIDSAPARGAEPARVQLSARLAPGAAPGQPRQRAADAARIEWRGQAVLAPLMARGSLRVERLPLALFEPYVAAGLNVDVLRADAGFRGDVSLRQRSGGFAVGVRGDALLADVRVQTRPSGLATPDELLNWQALDLRGLRLEMSPGTKPRIEVASAELNDFFSRLVITEQGRFNVLDVAPPAAPAPTAAAEPAPAAAPAPTAASGPTSAAAAAPARDAGLPLDLVVGETKLVNGRIDFSDRFIRPNFSAQLTELNGRLGRLVSGSPEMATLELRGRAAGTALLDIRGALNPTADPLALDIQAKATDLELAPLSPYAGKYAGYAIERGKLSMDVAYRIDPDGKLDAKNQVILNQLTFGDKVESPDATKLPVRLAVALLKDRNGVIDVNLPVSGSINDPQFSVFGIVLKIIGNLLVKAVTAPFSLLAGGGSDDLSVVEFTPGSATPTESAGAVLDKVAKALVDRPALKMTVTGAADPASERDAVQRAALESRLLAERRRELLRGGAPSDVAVTMSADDRARLLRELYRQTDLPGKPRNFIGMQKDVPPAEMEAALRTATVVSNETARELALQRGLAVRDGLIARGLPSDRLFLAAPKLHASNESDAAWVPQVQLLLSAS